MSATPSPFLSIQAADRKAREAAWLYLALAVLNTVVVGDHLGSDQVALQLDHAPPKLGPQIVEGEDVVDHRQEPTGVARDISLTGCAVWRESMCAPYGLRWSFSSCK